MQAKRIEWIDLAKGMAIFLMVCGHTSIPANLSNWIWSFHMPLFFIVSGMLFYPNRYPSFSSFVTKRCRTLLLPWIVFTIVTVCYSPAESLRLLSGCHNLFALWFLPVIFLTELIGFYIMKIRFWGGKLIFAVLLATIGFIMDMHDVSLPFDIEVCLYATLFYVVGYVSRERIMKTESKWLMIVLLLGLNVLLSLMLPRTDMAANHCGWYGINAINAMVGTMAFFLLAKKTENLSAQNFLRRFLAWAGANTIVILGLSQVINLLMKECMISLPLSNGVNSLLRHVLLWVVLWVIATLINKYIPEIIGKKRILK